MSLQKETACVVQLTEFYVEFYICKMIQKYWVKLKPLVQWVKTMQKAPMNYVPQIMAMND